MNLLYFYTTPGCHLCAEAEALFTQISAQISLPQVIAVELVDIAESAALVTRYGSRIPVLQWAASGGELAWPFSASDLQIFLQKGPEES